MSKILETTVVTAQFEGVITNHNIGELQDIQVAYNLNGKNYLNHTFLKGKGTLSHLMGIEPRRGDPWFDAQDGPDSMIMTWLWNSMMPEISDTYIFDNCQRHLGCCSLDILKGIRCNTSVRN